MPRKQDSTEPPAPVARRRNAPQSDASDASLPVVAGDGLTPAQSRFLAERACGRTLTAAAKAAGVARSTATRWMQKNECVISAWRGMKHEMGEALQVQAQLLAALSARALREILEQPDGDPHLRAKVALAIFERFAVGQDRDDRPPSAEDVAIELAGRDQSRSLKAAIAGLNPRRKD